MAEQQQQHKPASRGGASTSLVSDETRKLVSDEAMQRWEALKRKSRALQSLPPKKKIKFAQTKDREDDMGTPSSLSAGLKSLALYHNKLLAKLHSTKTLGDPKSSSHLYENAAAEGTKPMVLGDHECKRKFHFDLNELPQEWDHL